MAADPAVDRPGLVAGRYELRDPLGCGGMGEVRAAWDNRLERPVAVKTLRSDVAAQPSARRRFETEARSAARLVHPNVVSVYDSGEDAGIPFMVMELLPGRSLRDEIAEGPMTVGAVRSLASQVLGALAAAHAAGILHRDIKPANILATENGHWKVTDFGIAKSVEMQGSDETATGMVLGTPAYLAPERLFGGEATPAGDLYSLGVILYEALAAHRPFHADSPEGWAGVIAAQEPEPLLNVRADVPPAMAAAIGRSIARDPAGRFGSAAEMAEALGVGHGAGGIAGAIGSAGVPADAGEAEAVAGGGFGWHEVQPASPGGDTTLLTGTGVAVTQMMPAAGWAPAAPVSTPGRRWPRLAAGLAGAGMLDRRRRGLAALAAGAVVAAIVGLSVAAGNGSPSPATTTHQAPTTVSTLPPTTLPTTTLPPPPPAAKDKGGGGPGGGGPGGGGPGAWPGRPRRRLTTRST